MVVKVRLSSPLRIASPDGRPLLDGVLAQWAPALGLLMTPLALLAFTVAIWAFAAEFHWSSAFIFKDSLLAHWQVWLAIAAALFYRQSF